MACLRSEGVVGCGVDKNGSTMHLSCSALLGASLAMPCYAVPGLPPSPTHSHPTPPPRPPCPCSPEAPSLSPSSLLVRITLLTLTLTLTHPPHHIPSNSQHSVSTTVSASGCPLRFWPLQSSTFPTPTPYHTVVPSSRPSHRLPRPRPSLSGSSK